MTARSYNSRFDVRPVVLCLDVFSFALFCHGQNRGGQIGRKWRGKRVRETLVKPSCRHVLSRLLSSSGGTCMLEMRAFGRPAFSQSFSRPAPRGCTLGKAGKWMSHCQACPVPFLCASPNARPARLGLSFLAICCCAACTHSPALFHPHHQHVLYCTSRPPIVESPAVPLCSTHIPTFNFTFNPTAISPSCPSPATNAHADAMITMPFSSQFSTVQSHSLSQVCPFCRISSPYPYFDRLRYQTPRSIRRDCPLRPRIL